jgi:hypothetical protein
LLQIYFFSDFQQNKHGRILSAVASEMRIEKKKTRAFWLGMNWMFWAVFPFGIRRLRREVYIGWKLARVLR